MSSRIGTTFTLGYGDYLRFSRLVDELYGLHFPEKRRSDLEQGLRQAYAASTCPDLDAYYNLLRDSGAGSVHRQCLVNALTVGESHFFRDAGQFEALCTDVLPQIIEKKGMLRSLRIWSAGCAAGEEPYSLAIALRELLPDVDDWTISIFGTDVNTQVLDRARQARYGEWAFREDRAKHLRDRYFVREGKHYVLLPEVRRMVTFAQLNLVEDNFPSYRTNTMYLDLILCRNVTIYFSHATTQQIVGRFYDALVDEGWLVVGHSEHSLTTYRQFYTRSYPNAVLYQRQPSAPPQMWDWSDVAQEPEPEPEPVEAGFFAAPAPPAGPVAPPEVVPEQGKPERVPDNVDDVRALLEIGRSEAARDRLLQIVVERPRNAEAQSLLCQAHANLGEWVRAESACQNALRLNNLEQDAYYTLGLVQQHLGRLDEAVDALKKVIYVDSRSVRGHYTLASLYYSQGKLTAALKSLDNARRLLAHYDDRDLIPGTGGITAGNLRRAVVQQQQRWSAEALSRKGDL